MKVCSLPKFGSWQAMIGCGNTWEASSFELLLKSMFKGLSYSIAIYRLVVKITQRSKATHSELMSGINSQPLLIPIITWYKQTWSITNIILIIISEWKIELITTLVLAVMLQRNLGVEYQSRPTPFQRERANEFAAPNTWLEVRLCLVRTMLTKRTVCLFFFLLFFVLALCSTYLCYSHPWIVSYVAQCVC